MARRKAFWTIDEIRAACVGRGSKWWEPSAMRFFGTRVGSFVYCGRGGVFFVTSERCRFDPSFPRLYTVRRFDVRRRMVDTVGEFQAYKTARAAHRAASRLARGVK